jgi:hypothetical protein
MDLIPPVVIPVDKRIQEIRKDIIGNKHWIIDKYVMR